MISSGAAGWLLFALAVAGVVSLVLGYQALGVAASTVVLFAVLILDHSGRDWRPRIPHLRR